MCRLLLWLPKVERRPEGGIGSALAVEISAGPHNRLLRRQHCSSLCSQSEGHEYVANMANALGMTFLVFQPMFGRHNIRPPHFASKVSDFL